MIITPLIKHFTFTYEIFVWNVQIIFWNVQIFFGMPPPVIVAVVVGSGGADWCRVIHQHLENATRDLEMIHRVSPRSSCRVLAAPGKSNTIMFSKYTASQQSRNEWKYHHLVKWIDFFSSKSRTQSNVQYTYYRYGAEGCLWIWRLYIYNIASSSRHKCRSYFWKHNSSHTLSGRTETGYGEEYAEEFISITTLENVALVVVLVWAIYSIHF